MSTATGWFKNDPSGCYTVFYENPLEHGLPEEEFKEFIPLYDDWQDRLQEIEGSIQKGESIHCNEDGTFEKINVPIYQEPEQAKSDIEQLAEFIKNGINSV